MPADPPAPSSSLHWERQQWQGVSWRHAAMTGEAARVELRDADIALAGNQPSALAAAELVLEGLRVQATLDLARLLALARQPAAPPVLDALRGMEGRLQAFVIDAAWILDATLTLPVHQGRIDFDQVTVEHLGPDSSMGLSAGGLYVDAPQLGRRYLYLFTAALPAGLQTEERRGRDVADRGLLDLPDLLAALLQAPQLPGRWANDDSRAAALSRSRLAGELHLGDGEFQVLGAGLRFTGHALGANRVAMAAPSLDEAVTLRLPQLAAEALRAGAAGWALGCERIEGELALQLDGGWTRGGPLRVTLDAPRLTLRGLRAQASASGE